MQDIEVTAEPGSGQVKISAWPTNTWEGDQYFVYERNPDQARALARELLAAADRAVSGDTVRFCSWCPEPTRPDPHHHPGGQRTHEPIQRV